MTLTAAGVTAVLSLSDGVLEAQVTAPGDGWVLVGLNDRPQLAGTHLAMAAVVDGAVVAEHRLADPPQRTLPKVDDAWILGAQADGGTITLRLDPSVEGLPRLDQDVWVTLAWSHEPDFEHHSADRATVKMPAWP